MLQEEKSEEFMMKKDPKISWFAAILAVLAAMLCRQVDTGNLFLDKLSVIVRSFIYIGLFTGWGFYLKRRIIHKRALFYLELIAGCMVFWFLIRTLKYSVFYDIVLMRWCWYLYYVPFILIPGLSFSTARFFGKVGEEKIRTQDKFFWGTAIVLIGLVLTNDLHQLIFTFPAGKPFSDADNSYGILFPLIMFWIGGCMLLTIFILIRRCRIPERKMLYLPLVPVGCIFLWCILNMIRAPFLKVFAGDMTAFICLFTAITFECCVQCGLIQTNVRYPELFDRCTGISMELINKENKICYVSGDGFPDFPEEILPTTGQTVYLKNGNKLNSMPVNGGYVYWTEDSARLHQLKKELLEVQEELYERNKLLHAEYKKESERKRIEEKNRLYDLMQFQTADQMQKLSMYMKQIGNVKNAEEYESLMENIIVTGTYLKRRNNLVLTADENGKIPELEIYLALKEFCSSIPSNRLQGQFYIHTQTSWLPLWKAVKYLDVLEYMISCYERKLSWFFIRIVEAEKQIRATISIRIPEKPEQLLKKYPDIYAEQEEEGEWFLRLQ